MKKLVNIALLILVLWTAISCTSKVKSQDTTVSKNDLEYDYTVKDSSDATILDEPNIIKIGVTESGLELLNTEPVKTNGVLTVALVNNSGKDHITTPPSCMYTYVRIKGIDQNTGPNWGCSFCKRVRMKPGAISVAKTDFRFEENWIGKVKSESLYNLPNGTYEAEIAYQGREVQGTVFLEYKADDRDFLKRSWDISREARCKQIEKGK